MAEHIQFRTAELHTLFPGHPGCLDVNGVVAGPDDAEPVRRALIEFRDAGQERLHKRLQPAICYSRQPRMRWRRSRLP